MRKAVLMSINPKWVEMILNGKKTIEVRKTAPKLETPFKVYVYCTKDRDTGLFQGANLPMHSKSRDYNNIQVYACNEMWAKDHRDRINGKVVAEFTCDEIIDYIPVYDKGKATDYLIARSYPRDCLTKEERMKYGAGERLYGLHISDLKVYEQPKELSEFDLAYCRVSFDVDCNECPYYDWNSILHSCRRRRLTRPPQSWCYVEEIK